MKKNPRTGRLRSSSKQGERSLISLVKRDRKRSVRDWLEGFSLSVPVPICKISIQRRLSENGFHRRTSSDSFEMETNIEQILAEQSSVLKACDLLNTAEAVKAVLMADIRKFISAATAPLHQLIKNRKRKAAR